MTLFKVAVVIPAVISGVWLSQPDRMDDAAKARHDSHASVALTHQLSSDQTSSDGRASEKDQGKRVEREQKKNDRKIASREIKKSSAKDVTTISAERTARLEAEVLARRIRIERILGILDQLAEASNQMNPDTSARIEPVVLDIAERTLELTDVPAMLDSETDEELEDIEVMLARLVGVITRMIEPEMSL